MRGGQVISLANFPTSGGTPPGPDHPHQRHAVTLTLTGQQPAGPVLFQLPAFVGNIAHASAGTVDEQTGTVTVRARRAHRHGAADEPGRVINTRSADDLRQA